MFKVVALALAVVIISPSVEAQGRKCYSLDIMNRGTEEVGEYPIVRFNDGPILSYLFLNPDTGTWTLIQKIGNGYCTIADGEGFELNPDPIEDAKGKAF